MKIVCVFLLVLLHQYDCKPTSEDMKKADSLCYGELHFQPSDVPDITNFAKESVDTPKNREMFACLFTKMGILDSEQKIVSEGFDNFVDVLVEATRGAKQNETLMREYLSPCKDIEGRSGGEIGFLLRNCIWRAGLEVRRRYSISNTP